MDVYYRRLLFNPFFLTRLKREPFECVPCIFSFLTPYFLPSFQNVRFLGFIRKGDWD